MVLNGGTLDGKRVLSEAAVVEMTKRQTPEALKVSSVLGWSVGGGTFGHGEAMVTNMTVDPKRGILLECLVQQAGFPGTGAKAHEVFRKAAAATFKGSVK